jgi:hypothetical protein
VATAGNGGHRNKPVRKRRVPRPETRRDAWTQFEPAQHSGLTPEGQIEQYGVLARGLKGTTGWRRWLGRGFLGLMLIVFIGGAIAPLVMVVLWLR